MSFGKTKSKQESTQQSTSTQSLDPATHNALLQRWSDINGGLPTYQPYTGDKVAGFTPDQQSAFGILGDIAQNQTGASTLNSGILAAQGVANAGTPTVSTGPIASTGYSPVGVLATAAAHAGQVDPSMINSVTAGQVGDTDLSKYLNPYTDSVVNATAADAQHALQVQQNQNASDATRAGAWRGNALAVQNGVAQADTNRALASTIAQLRQSGFTDAQAQAQADLNRRLTADQGNQATDLAAGTTNATLGTSTEALNAQIRAAAAQADAAAGNTASQFGAAASNTAGLQTAQNALSAAQGNQSAELQARAQRLTAAGLLGTESDQQLAQAQSRANGLLTAGNQQQALNQADLDWAYQNNFLAPQQYMLATEQLKNQTLALLGNPILGSSQSTGSSTGSSSGFNIGLTAPTPPGGSAGGAPTPAG